MGPPVTLRDRGERYRSSNHKSSSSRWRHSRVWLYPRLRPVDRQHKPPDPACPGPGPHGIRPERGSSRAAETSCRRRSDATRSRWCRRCSRRLALVTATSASTGAIMPAAAASAHCSTAGRRSGAGCRRPGHGHRFPPPRTADGTRVLAPPVPPGQLHLLQEPLVITGQGTT